MPPRVLKLDAKGKSRQRANDADKVYGIVWRHRPLLPKHMIAIAARRIGNRIYTIAPDKIGKAIDRALKAPITEEERTWGDRRAMSASTNPEVKEGMDRAIAVASAAAGRSLDAWVADLLRRGDAAEQAGRYDASITALKVEAEYVPPPGMPKKDAPTVNVFNGASPFDGWNLGELAAWREERRAKMVEGTVVNEDSA